MHAVYTGGKWCWGGEGRTDLEGGEAKILELERALQQVEDHAHRRHLPVPLDHAHLLRQPALLEALDVDG